MVEFVALPFPFSSKLTVWPFHNVVVQERQTNLPEKLMYVQSCYFSHLTYNGIFDVSDAVAVVVS